MTRTSPPTENLIAAARRAGVGHIVYVSIVGIDRIPLPYYKTKLRVERALEASGVGHTVLRATQFHDLIETIFSIQRFSPLLCALRGCGSSPSTPATSPRGSSNSSTANRPGGSPTSAAPPCTHTPSWHACILLPAAAVDAWSSCRCRDASSQAIESGANLAPDNPVGTIGFADISPNE